MSCLLSVSHHRRHTHYSFILQRAKPGMMWSQYHHRQTDKSCLLCPCVCYPHAACTAHRLLLSTSHSLPSKWKKKITLRRSNNRVKCRHEIVQHSYVKGSIIIIKKSSLYFSGISMCRELQFMSKDFERLSTIIKNALKNTKTDNFMSFQNVPVSQNNPVQPLTSINALGWLQSYLWS